MAHTRLSKHFCWMMLVATLAAGQVKHQHHPPASAEDYAKILNDPKRDKWQKPHEVITALELKPTDVVADIGAGTGYFANRIAHHVGKVYALDIDPKILEILRKDAPDNVDTVLARPDDPRLPEGSIDLVFFCDVVHHIENRPAYYARVAKSLKPGGRVVVIDFHKKKLPVGPPVSMKLSEQQVIKEFENAGLVKTKSLTFLPYQYFLVFQKRT